MHLFHSVRGISKLIFLISLLIALIVGATLSYVWTMGFYASEEYQLPENPALSIELPVDFSAQNATFFEIVILNPSYSSSSADIDQILVLTEDGALHNVEVSPSLPLSLEVGGSETFRGIWNWANFTGQTAKVIVFVTGGSGPTAEATLPYVGLTVEAHFNSAISTQQFNLSVQNAETSATHVDITKLTINSETITSQNTTINGDPVSFPYFLNSSQSVTFTVAWNWTSYQGQSVTVAAETSQGYIATWRNEV
ncbi:MAG: hypothetical protein PVF15_07330 [Candidatus Bathyarchaeota archaeon]|jgi:hypothetical protein